MHCRLAGRASMDIAIPDKMRRPDENMDISLGLWALMILRNRVGLVPWL